MAMTDDRLHPCNHGVIEESLKRPADHRLAPNQLILLGQAAACTQTAPPRNNDRDN